MTVGELIEELKRVAPMDAVVHVPTGRPADFMGEFRIDVDKDPLTEVTHVFLGP